MTQLNDIITDENGNAYVAAAVWCNENNAVLEEIEPENGKRRFQVKSIPEPTIEEKKTLRISELQNFLNDTDWYAVRFAETGIEIPDKIKTERQSAREEISRLRDNNQTKEE